MNIFKPVVNSYASFIDKERCVIITYYGLFYEVTYILIFKNKSLKICS